MGYEMSGQFHLCVGICGQGCMRRLILIVDFLELFSPYLRKILAQLPSRVNPKI